ncbi:MAG: redoxin domain-containing protein [Prolixibacteraceae bacterium]|jgi:peroxiredoxin|nr:redoxin domain-containing protein [Prolixibacteraceae bacterium]
MKNSTDEPTTVQQIFERVRAHEFNPLNEENSLTIDRKLNVDGIADLNNDDWRVRLLAVRDLVTEGIAKVGEIAKGLVDISIDVRQISAMTLGILNAKSAINALEHVVRTDDNTMVRSQAVIALGQLESKESLSLLREKLKEDSSRDVRHQCELAIYQIENQMGVTNKQLAAFLSLDKSTFETAKKGLVAPDFVLEDTEGKEWQLSLFRNKKWVILIWVFADWCPVCHSEFHDLMKKREEFNKAAVQVFTLEIHDKYRGRVMVGKELEPSYWFSKESFKEAYTKQIWWPHLLDRAGKNAAIYGADPLAFSVHAEYINRPTTVIIDPQGMVRYIYNGTFWGDRPTIEQTLKMIENEDFTFEHAQRRKDKKYD